MNKIDFAERVAIMLFVPALIGLFMSKTLIGSIMLGVSITIIKNDTHKKFIILGDVMVLLVVCHIILEYYVQNKGLAFIVALIGIGFACIFGTIELIKRRRN